MDRLSAADAKAADDSRTPRRFAHTQGRNGREASWSAAVVCRFSVATNLTAQRIENRAKQWVVSEHLRTGLTGATTEVSVAVIVRADTLFAQIPEQLQPALA